MKTSGPGDYSTVNNQQAAPQETPPTLSGNICYGQLDTDIVLDDNIAYSKQVTSDKNSDGVYEVIDNN